MSALVACAGCDRHLREQELACPFCGRDARDATPGRFRIVSRRELTRAAVFTGAALALGCGSASEEEEEQQDIGGGTGSGGEDTTLDDTDDDEVSDGTGDGDTEDDFHEEDLYRDRRRSCDDPACLTMPYGAPSDPDAFV